MRLPTNTNFKIIPETATKSLNYVCNHPTTRKPNLTHITHRYLEDFLCVIEHLNPYGDLSPWRLGRRTQAWLQGGHPKTFRGAQPLCGRRRPVGWFDHGDGCYSEGLSSCRNLCSRLEEKGENSFIYIFRGFGVALWVFLCASSQRQQCSVCDFGIFILNTQ